MKAEYWRLGAISACFAFASAAQGEVLDTLNEYGNAATADLLSGAGIARGFTNPAAGEYTITAGGTDIWSPTDHGTFIHDADVVQSGNFSAVVRVSSIGEVGEFIPGEWGRTGVMARQNPSAANSANVAHIRKSGSANAFTTMQWRDTTGANTDRAGSEHGNVGANTAGGTVDDTPLWLALHRYDGTYYSTWADDVAGSPGVWSDIRQHPATGATDGDVYVGLCHQNHGAGNPNGVMTSTATFDSFNVGAFDNALGDFPAENAGSLNIDFGSGEVRVTASTAELGDAAGANDADWEVRFIGPNEVAPGGIRVDLFINQNNQGNRAAFDAVVAGEPSGSTVINTIRWAASNYIETNPGGVNLFAEAVPGAFLANQDQYAANTYGEIFIPSDASRDGVESVRFHDGVDDYCLLVIDDVTLIDHNGWSNLAGTGNNGGTQATLDVSDAKFDDGEWVPFQLGTWEGGGGDDAVINWDALDTTGVDDVTGATDSVIGSYNPDNLPDGVQVSFAHDRSDEIPSANLRTSQPSTIDDESGFGQPVDQLLATLVPEDTVEVRLYVNGQLLEILLPDGDLDPDNDGLTNDEELALGTDRDNPDTDGDGLNDGPEVNLHGTDPTEADGDSDQLNDGEEIALGTDPANPDTDGDGVPDGLDDDPLTPGSGFGFGLISYWPMDGDLENAVVDDFHGTEDGPAIPFETGKFDNAIHLDGSHSVVIGGDENVMDFEAGSMSVSVWCTVDVIDTNWQCLIAKGEGNGWRMHRRGGDNPPQMAWTGGNGDIDAHGTPIMIGTDPETWHHYVGITDGATQTQYLYQDGVLLGEKAGAILQNRANPMRIGENPDALGRLWKGKVDDVGIWGRALSEEEVLQIWDDGDGASIEDLLGGGTRFEITEILYDQATDMFTLTWNSKEGRDYALYWGNDGVLFENDIDDAIEGEEGTTTFGPFPNPDLGADTLLFRVERN